MRHSREDQGAWDHEYHVAGVERAGAYPVDRFVYSQPLAKAVDKERRGEVGPINIGDEHHDEEDGDESAVDFAERLGSNLAPASNRCTQQRSISRRSIFYGGVWRQAGVCWALHGTGFCSCGLCGGDSHYANPEQTEAQRSYVYK